MKELTCRYAFGAFGIACMTGLQIFAWYTGHDGMVFATTTGLSGLIAGSLLGFQYGKSKQ